MSYLKRTSSGGRLARREAGHGSYRVEWSPEADRRPCRLITDDGREIGSAYIEFSEPDHPAAPPPPGPEPHQPRRRQVLPPGRWLGMGIQVLTLGLVRPCTGCQSRARAMDRAGWRGLPVLWARWAWRQLAWAYAPRGSWWDW